MPRKKSPSRKQQPKPKAKANAGLWSPPPAPVSLAIQQRLLTAFATAHPSPSFFVSASDAIDAEADAGAEAVGGGGLSAAVQAVKKSLYERDFASAFATSQRRTAYVARWSAGRALGYAAVFAGVLRHLCDGDGNEQERDQDLDMADTEDEDKDVEAGRGNPEAPRPRRTVVVCCLGGGAGAELAGLTAAVWAAPPAHVSVTARLVDAADWSTELSRLHDALVASETATTYGGPSVSPDFRLGNALDLTPVELKSLLAGAGLVTIMFTLNELFTASVRRATALLLALRSAIKVGGLLLVVDSAGSYATVKLGEAEKRYPMQWLLDHTMLGSSGEAGEDCVAEWIKIRGEESTWFRVARELQYPLELENMRYQLHLYRRSG
jgi:25S rRNA (uracil2843-N3)-methyltransferase